jgi:predicted metal-dependent hydrolase
MTRPTDYSMPPDVERKLYYDGIHLFNEKEFFEAHEVWEDAWHMAYGTKFEFYQGMIQCAVALEHYRRQNPRGVLSLFESYNRHFKDVPDVFMGLEVKKFLEQMRAVLEPVLIAKPVPERGQIELDASRAPIIELKYDPFQTGEAQRFAKPRMNSSSG